MKLQTQLLSVHKDAVSQIIDNALVGLGSVEQEPCDQNSVCGGGKQERTDGKQEWCDVFFHRLRKSPVDSESNQSGANNAKRLATDYQKQADRKTLLDWLHKTDQQPA